MTLPTTLRRIGPLTIALTLALGANFAYSAWSQPDPGVVPPDGNTAPPIDVSDLDQDKEGGLSLGGNLSVPEGIALADQMRAREYCDYNGENCSGSASGGGSVPGAEEVGSVVLAITVPSTPSGGDDRLSFGETVPGEYLCPAQISANRHIDNNNSVTMPDGTTDCWENPDSASRLSGVWRTQGFVEISPNANRQRATVFIKVSE